MDNKTLREKILKIESTAKKCHELSIMRGYDDDLKEMLLKIIIDSNRIIEGIENDPDVLSGAVKRRIFPGGIHTKDRIEENRREDIHIVAYWMSKYEHVDLFPQYNQTDAFNYLSGVLGIKHNTLKNYRDSFDPYTGSHRRGWVDGPRSDMNRRVFNRLEKLNREEVLEMVKRIIVKYK